MKNVGFGHVAIVAMVLVFLWFKAEPIDTQATLAILAGLFKICSN